MTPPQRTHVMMYVWRRIQGDPSTKDTRDDVRMYDKAHTRYVYVNRMSTSDGNQMESLHGNQLIN